MKPEDSKRPTVVFLEGYLSSRAAKEGMPKYSYPLDGGVPKCAVPFMKMETSFLTARKGNGRPPA